MSIMTDKKKRFNRFLSLQLQVGCVKGFRYFATHLRGREEMVCSVMNEPSIPILLSATNSPASSFGRYGQESFPKEVDSVMISHNQQRRLSGYGFINVGLPPASPSENEQEDHEDDCTMFLIAGYARYNCPYVWIRTNHERIVQFSDGDNSEKDYPLKLKTTSSWREKNITPADVIAELVAICTSPSPPNPFAVDFDYFESLPLQERFLASGAMMNFLRQVLSTRTHSYDRRMRADLQKISGIHFRSLCLMSEEGILPSASSTSDVNPSSTTSTLPSAPPPSPLRKYPNLTS